MKFGFGILFFVLPFYALAQGFRPDADWRFENFNSQNHFISTSIFNMTMDKHGYMWTCSRGIQRFDGYKTVDFNSLRAGPGSLRSNYTDVAADSSGRVWVSAAGLCYYDDAGAKFVYVKPDPNHAIAYTQGFCFQKNYLWFVCNYGLVRLDLRSLKITYTSLGNVTDPLSTTIINDTAILVSSREKIYSYNIKKDTYNTSTLIYNHTSLKVFAVAKKGPVIFLATTGGLFILKNLNEIMQVDGLRDITIADLLFLPADKEKKYLFLATDGNGLMVYNTVSKKVEFTYTHDDNNPYSLARNVLLKMFCDKNGRLWIGTSSGMSMLDINNQRLKVRFLHQTNNNGLNINAVAMDKYDSTKVWMSCNIEGMISMNWKTKEIDKVFNLGGDLKKVYDFAQVSPNKWLLVTQKKIIEWAPRSGVLLTKNLPVPDSVGAAYYIRRIIAADANTYFITTSLGLFKYDILAHQVSVAAVRTTNTADDQLKYNLQNGFYDNGIVWVASRDGLFSYNVTSHAARIYRGMGANANYYLFDVRKANNGQLVCAAGAGITIFNTLTGSFKVISSIAGLNQPDCENVICLKNMVWINSEAGILNYDMATGRSSKFEQAPLIQFSPGSPFMVVGNEVAFGYDNGYAYFAPDLKNNLVIPSDPVIENVTVNNQPLYWQYGAGATDKPMALKHTDNSINISFTSFLYTDADNINFRYMLKGAGTHWQYTIEQRSANYAQLPPGSYTFFVQSGNKNGVWNKHLAALQFSISPPYWQTVWFRLLVVIVIAVGLYQLYQYKIKHIKAIEKIRATIASDFHDDLGSTLSSISIFSEVAKKKAETDIGATKTLVDDIGMRARSMINSMNDMVWIIKPENDNLYRLVQRMEEFGYPVAEAREVQLVFNIDKHLYDLKTDMPTRKNLFLIFKEAFNNAMKYSGAEKIEVSFALKQKRLLTMEITDNGCGFNFESRKAGNGLGNMQKRAAEINGKLKISSTPAAGTSINLICRTA
jgi:ligand-binding sensor domain-containing protein/two-component sensor histidine kinase